MDPGSAHASMLVEKLFDKSMTLTFTHAKSTILKREKNLRENAAPKGLHIRVKIHLYNIKKKEF